jgi:hypothetical protein
MFDLSWTLALTPCVKWALLFKRTSHPRSNFCLIWKNTPFLPSFLLVQGYVLRFYFNKTSSLVPKLVLHSRLPNSSPNCFSLDLVPNLDRIWFGSSYIFNGTSIVQPIKSYHLYQLHAPNPQNLYTYLRHVPKVITLMPPSPQSNPQNYYSK